MAQVAATPENLQDFAEQLGERLSEELADLGGGDSSFIFVESYIKKDTTDGEGKPHLYLVMDSSISLTGLSLRYCRKGRVRCRRKDSSPYHNNDGDKAHTTGWHQVWQLPLHTTKTPLIQPILASTTPAFVIAGNAYYEITVEDYDTMYDFINDSEFDTGYVDAESNPVSIGAIMRKQGGVCLVRDGVQISNFAHFRASYDESNGVYSIGR